MKRFRILFKTFKLAGRFGRTSGSFACLFGLLVPTTASAVPDAVITQGVWKVKFGVTSAQLADINWQNADTDGDGLTNIDECAAGTNPFLAGEVVKITSITATASDVSLTFPTVNKKQYVVQGSATLSSFANVPGPVTWNGTGVPKTLNVSKGANKFFRVLVQDMDTDGDGVCDWAELQTGLNPNSATTTPGVNDLDYVTEQIALPHEVNIVASETFASEDGPTSGKFTISRTQKLLPITVSLNAAGTAVLGTDYAVVPSPALPGSVDFDSGVDLVEIIVNPMANAPVEGSESVTASLVAPAGPQPSFTLGANSSATVIIRDSTAPTGTGLTARYYDHASNIYAHAANLGDLANYAFTRGSPTTTGTIVVTPTTGNLTAILAAVSVGTQVRLTFNGGNLNNALYNHLNYSVTAKTASNFTVSITAAAALPANSSSNCYFSIHPIHPAVIERIDPVVDNDWAYGTPSGVVITGSDVPDNYSASYDGYLHPTTAGDYTFQLDADDKARVLLDTGSGLVEILEHGWDGVTTPETVGTFKQSGLINLAVPGSAAARYRIRVEHVETTGDARCRLQWRVPGTTTFVNVPSSNVFSHTRTLTSYSVSGAVATINTSGAHGLSVGNTVELNFSSGLLFTPPANYSGNRIVATVIDADSFTVSIPGAPNTSGGGFLTDSTSTTAGWLNRTYGNTAFSSPAGRVGVDGGGATNVNNGILGIGTPDVALINHNTFSIRWAGQVQPQFSEDYTFVVHADDGSNLWINGQLQEMKTSPSTSTGVGTYDYSSVTGDAIVNYTTSVVKPGSFIVGETVRVDPTSGNLTHGTGSTYTFDGVTGILTVNYSNLTNITAGGFSPGETIELDPTSGSLTTLATLPYVIIDEPTTSTFRVDVGTGLFDTGSGSINIADTRNAVITKLHVTGSTYSYNSTTGDAVINYASLTGVAPGSFAVTDTVELDPTSGNLSPLTSIGYTIIDVTPTTFTVNFGIGAFVTGSGNINIAAPANGVIPAAITNAFTINFGTGKYSTGTGNINVEIANKPLKEWASMGNERYVRIPVIGGTRYDIQLDYYENTSYSRCRLFWYSASQPKQIIPTERLYPSSGTLAPTAHITPTDATALVGGAFSLPISGSNGASVTLSGNPAWLTYSAGILSGTPPPGSGGDYQILVTITNAAGTSTSVVNLHVEDAGGTIVREYWNGVAGATVASIPVGNTPTGTTNLTSLEGPTDFGDDYGARIRGYINAPETGNYYFWIAASNAAELWISNDDEPVNAFKRAWVNTGNATPQTWNGEASQKSPWLALEQGKRYYIEILHKAGVGSGDNLAVGWSKPGQSTTAPSQVVPGFVLSPYVAPAPGSTPGTLYVATMLAQGGAVTNGVGSSTLRLSEDENTAIMNYSYAGLTGPITSQHIHTDPYLSKPSTIVFDIDTPATPGDGLQPDGSYKWTILPVGTLAKADIIEIIKQGKAYINLHTALYPSGEIRGNYTLANGSRTFTPPPAPPSWTDDHTNAAAASRFLTQATFGPSVGDITDLQAMASYEAWIDDQFTKPASLQLPEVIRTENASAQGGAFASTLTFNAWWWRSIAGEDQLRQRIAFALSEIHVVSAQGPLENNALATSYFYDKLAENAFGNFRDILEDTTLTPSMGRYLDMLNNDKPDPTVGRIPNENYAREIKQLFSVGLYRMWPDGTLMLTSEDTPIDTYTQREIIGFAHVFTGWTSGYDGAYRTSLSAPSNWTRQMREVPVRHYTGTKRLLNNEVLPGLTSLGGQPLDPYATQTSNHYNDPTYQALSSQELDVSHNQLFNHPNVGPFICRQLIQRLVTSHPSRDYLYRVVQKFNDNGSGVRGDMKAVIKAMLLDYEARSPALLNIPAYGKQREPVMRVAAAARAFRKEPWTGTYSQTGTRTITINATPPQVHGLSTSGTVFLDFTSGSGGPAPWIGAYSATYVDADTINITARDWAAATSYSIPANSTTCTVTMSNHWLEAGHQAYFDFTAVTGGALPADGVYTVVTSNATNTTGGTTFTINVAPVATARSGASGSVAVPRFTPGSYTTTASGLAVPNDRRVTMDTNVNHELLVGDQVQLNFYFGSSPQPTDMVVTVESIVDLNTWTFLASGSGTGLSPNRGYNYVYQFPLKSLPMTRTGTVGSRPSTFAVGSTTTDLEQTPLNSPTVFNYFLPDYKYAGSLASQGITTPEFQLTAETTVVRQANYLYNGLFNPNQNFISSFNTGNNALVMNYSSWMGTPNSSAQGPFAPTIATLPWTHNQNLTALIDHMSTLLMAGQLSPGAKLIIRNFLATPIASFGTGANATVNTTVPHNLNTGDSVVISGVIGGTFGGTASALNSNSTARAITKVDADTFTINSYSCTVLPTNVASAHVSIIAYNNLQTPIVSAPTAAQMRDRLRNIIHLIVTSPDFTIQR